MSARAVATVLAAGSLAACQAAPPRLPGPPARLAPEVLERFTLAPPESPPALEPVHLLGRSASADEEGTGAPAAAIELDDVLDAVERHFPLVLAAREEIEIAEGALQRARGGFDTRLESRGEFDVEGFYDRDRFDVAVEQPTALWGLGFEGGYRFGGGDFPVYEGGEKTNEDGELRLKMSLPLLQSRTIDPRRVELWRARLGRQQADPIVQAKLLETTRDAAEAYWAWVAAGRLREIAVRQLALAEDRREQVELAVAEGFLAPINLTENQRLIVDRQARLVGAERRLQETAIALSLYWREADGRPAVPDDGLLPYEFPAPRPAADVLIGGDDVLAIEQRPEVRAVRLDLEKLALERDLARNAILPRLDLGVFASRDLGAAVNVPDDKGDLELGALLTLEVPLQRRRARGTGRELQAKLSQLERKAQFLREVIVSDVQDARSALTQSWLSIGQARENVRLANELADAERFQLAAGESDLLRVNLREQQAAAAAASFVDVLEKYFRALAGYRAVLGVPYSSPPVPERVPDP